MVAETYKSAQRRNQEGFFQKYLQGEGIDIGCGNTPILKERCYCYDRDTDPKHDANYVAEIADTTYDWVFSSHCLEHMTIPAVALRNWWRILKPGGYMVVVVPCVALYEQLQVPSGYNAEHKWSFSLGNHPNIPHHYSICDLVEQLPAAQIRYCITNDAKFDYAQRRFDRTWGIGSAELEVVVHKRPNNYFTKEGL